MTCYPVMRDGERAGVVGASGTEHEITHRGKTWRFVDGHEYGMPRPIRKDGGEYSRAPRAFWDAYEVWRARRDAYRAGAEAMREACVRVVEPDPQHSQPLYDGILKRRADSIRALPIPEDK